jgi:hypothetical protein
MCTVTFIPTDGKVFLVSNRDEKHSRADALSPMVYAASSGKLLYPKDGEAGGTWIALHESGNAAVLLNGGWEIHTPDPPYRKSRGLILLDLIQAGSPVSSFLSIDLLNIEPFTVVCLDNGKLWEGVWDGKNRHLSGKDETRPHIWSSVTLYDADIRARREGWFREWLIKYNDPLLKDILDFHQFTGDGDKQNDLLMNRNDHLYTVSITGMEIGKNKGKMLYNDLRNDRRFRSAIMFSSFPATL